MKSPLPSWMVHFIHVDIYMHFIHVDIYIYIYIYIKELIIIAIENLSSCSFFYLTHSLTYSLSLFFLSHRYFNVTEKGEIKIITDPSKLTKSSYQLMIMVDDGGKPPRRTLVNVTVNFPALVVAGPSSGSGLSQSDTLLIVLGVFLAIFVILAVFLSIYIARRYVQDLEWAIKLLINTYFEIVQH